VNRRRFAGLSLAGLAWPLVGRSAQAKSPSPPPLTAPELAAKVDAAYGALQSFGARFKQRYSYHRKESTGSVLFERPDKMRWSYGNGNLAVSDGQTIKVYDRDNERVYLSPSDKSLFPVVLSFLTAPGGLVSALDLDVPPAARIAYRNGYVLSGRPRQLSPAFSRVLWFVQPEGFLVRRVVVVDAQSNRHRFDFERPKANPKVPAGSFTFTPPPGTQII
jgi:outer membrane lipoprotein carrier protein